MIHLQAFFLRSTFLDPILLVFLLTVISAASIGDIELGENSNDTTVDSDSTVVQLSPISFSRTELQREEIETPLLPVRRRAEAPNPWFKICVPVISGALCSVIIILVTFNIDHRPS